MALAILKNEAYAEDAVGNAILDAAFGRCEKLTGIIVDSANENYSSEDGVLSSKNQ